MQFVLFSKHWPGMDISAMIDKTQFIGADGLDLAVRAKMAVHPGNVRTELPRAVKQVRKAGLDVPMITTEASFIDPTDPVCRETAAAMAEAGVPIAKLGYWRWRQGETPYWKTVDQIRKALEGFEALAEEYDVAFCYHTHSDYFGLNACSMMDLLHERNPDRIGAYLDTGHLHYCGEPFRMAVDIVNDYLKLVSFKDTFFTRQNPEDEELPQWRRTIVPAGHGVVKWTEVMEALTTAGFDGTASVHCEFKANSQEEFTRLQKREVAFLRKEYADSTA